MSNIHMNIAPDKNPIVGITQFGRLVFSDNSIDGASKDQKLAAVITPAANPYIDANSFGFISDRKKNTSAEPNAVKANVILPPSSANETGDAFSIILIPFY